VVYDRVHAARLVLGWRLHVGCWQPDTYLGKLRNTPSRSAASANSKKSMLAIERLFWPLHIVAVDAVLQISGMGSPSRAQRYRYCWLAATRSAVARPEMVGGDRRVRACQLVPRQPVALASTPLTPEDWAK
jgi:hypothetical protein